MFVFDRVDTHLLEPLLCVVLGFIRNAWVVDGSLETSSDVSSIFS